MVELVFNQKKEERKAVLRELLRLIKENEQ